MNVFKDNREINTRVMLYVMNVPDTGFYSGEYMAATGIRSAENTSTINTLFDPVFNLGGVKIQKFSSRLRPITSLSNCRIPEVNTAPSVSSCTFSYGGIPVDGHPVFNRLRGAIQPAFVQNDDPKQSAIQGTPLDVINSNNSVPLIPFRDKGTTVKTYNIWSDGNQGEAYKYVGVKGANIKTFSDPNNGACIEIASVGKQTAVKRMFPTSQDAVYESPILFNPDGSQRIVNAKGIYGNNGFHINFSASNMSGNNSYVNIEWKPSIPNNNFINNFVMEFKLDKKPVLRFFDPISGVDVHYDELVGPVFDNKVSSFDLFVHFLGPNMLVGFTSDTQTWNTIIPSQGKQIWCPPDTEITIYASDCNVKFRYSALIFNNFANDSQFTDKSNYILASLVSSPNKPLNLSTIYNQFIRSGFRLNTNGGVGFNSDHPSDKNVSFYYDLRNSIDNKPFQFDFIEKNNDIKLNKDTYFFKVRYDSTIEGNAFLQVETPHPNYDKNFGSGLASGTPRVLSSFGMFVPIAEFTLGSVTGDGGGELTQWVSSWRVNCGAKLDNLSKIEKTADITLSNIDTTDFGRKILSLIEGNLLVVDIRAGYGDQSYSYFQGFITNTTYSRKGADSSVTLACEDIASYTLRNIYFEKTMLLGGLRHDLAIDALLVSSGFWDYYFRDNTNIDGLFLRLNNNAVNNQELLKCTITDKISDKLGILLNRLKTPRLLPTFRWAEDVGFVLEGRNNNIDNDLKFTGFDLAGKNLDVDSNSPGASANLLSIPDWHGLLTGSFTTRTNMDTYAAGVKTFGSTMTGFSAREDFDFNRTAISAFGKPPTANGADSQNFPYIGFRKYRVAAQQAGVIPDDDVINYLHNIYIQLSNTAIGSINFDCYVTRPLSFHGKFVISVLDSTTTTGEYIYESVNYSFNKAENLITASVSGKNIPITLGDI
jgi:hypothetical protein